MLVRLSYYVNQETPLASPSEFTCKQSVPHRKKHTFDDCICKTCFPAITCVPFLLFFVSDSLSLISLEIHHLGRLMWRTFCVCCGWNQHLPCAILGVLLERGRDAWGPVLRCDDFLDLASNPCFQHVARVLGNHKLPRSIYSTFS